MTCFGNFDCSVVLFYFLYWLPRSTKSAKTNTRKWQKFIHYFFVMVILIGFYRFQSSPRGKRNWVGKDSIEENKKTKTQQFLIPHFLTISKLQLKVSGDRKCRLQGEILQVIGWKVVERNLSISSNRRYTPSSSVSGYQHKLTYFIRTIPGFELYLQPVEDVSRHHFIPAIMTTPRAWR